METITLEFIITANESITLVPRIVMVLSRRGFTVKQLTSDPHRDSGVIRLSCTASGPARWRSALPGIMAKIHDVQTVVIKDN